MGVSLNQHLKATGSSWKAVQQHWMQTKNPHRNLVNAEVTSAGRAQQATPLNSMAISLV